jgi:YidC/Oxa1 family membrane protein insertase
MDVWHMWVNFFANSMTYFHANVGLTEAVTIVLITLAARLVLLPISFKSAYNAQKNKNLMQSIKPQVEKIRQLYKNDPQRQMRHTTELYKKNGIKFFDKLMLANIFSQAAVGLGIFQSILKSVTSGKFLWVANIAKPDVIIAFVVGLITFLVMFYNPGQADQVPMIFVLLPVVLSTIALLTLPSAVGIYWATSNIFTAVQSLALRIVINRENNHLKSRSS